MNDNDIFTREKIVLSVMADISKQRRQSKSPLCRKTLRRALGRLEDLLKMCADERRERQLVDVASENNPHMGQNPKKSF